MAGRPSADSADGVNGVAGRDAWAHRLRRLGLKWVYSEHELLAAERGEPKSAPAALLPKGGSLLVGALPLGKSFPWFNLALSLATGGLRPGVAEGVQGLVKCPAVTDPHPRVTLPSRRPRGEEHGRHRLCVTDERYGCTREGEAE